MRSPRFTRDHSAGLTLAELIVAIMVLAILLTATVGLYSAVVSSTAETRARDLSTKAASNAMREVSQIVRNAVRDPLASSLSDASPFVVARTQSMTIYSVTAADAVTMEPRKVAFSVSSTGDFIEQTWVAVRKSGVWEWPSASQSRVLGSAFAKDSLFTYRNQDGVVLTVASAGATEAQRLQIASVSVTLTAGSGKTRVTVENTVTMPNLDTKKDQL